VSSIEESLARLADALERNPGPRRPPPRPSRQVTAVFETLAIALIVAGQATHNKLLLALGLLLAVGGAALYVVPMLESRALEGGGASIGLGATVAEGAVIEPGASVEMGATIGRGAIVRSGAVVRMGATVEREAVIERGAMVSWGADVKRGAVVGERAVVGAGSTVGRGARVPPGTRILPGTSIAGGASLPAAPAPAAVRDPRDQKLADVCNRLEAELKSAPEHVRAFLGGSEQTIVSLRRTCEDLSRRERAMRAEVDPQAIARLDEERTGLEKRLAEEKDPEVRKSLEGALAAVGEWKRQRDLIRLGADRLQAEHTRLLYTLEALASQFVRLRTAGAGAAPADLEASVQQLRAGIDAIADALEQVSREAPAAMRELAVAPPDSTESAPGLDRSRGRQQE
jgi:carbonic anhydrase/acetyltransferase-like protein (isoleucine patch superfamily)